MERGFALVTGASRGIGRAIALELARRGFGIIGTARSEGALRETLEACTSLNHGRTHAIVQDLAEEGAVDRLVSALPGVPLDVLVNNAGHGAWGRFHRLPLQEQLCMARVNMLAPVELTHRLLPRLLARPRAHVLNIGSAAGYTPLATMAIYAAGKAFVRSWSRALRLELRGTPVSVTCVCPGSVTTGFTERAGMQAMDALAKRFGRPPEAIARSAVRAMLRGRAETVPGPVDAVAAWLMRILPVALTERVASGIYLERLTER